MTNLFRKSLLALILLTPGMSLADSEDRSSFWFMSLNRFQLQDNFRAFIDLQPRFTLSDIPGGNNSAIDTLLMRGALGYQIKPNIGIYQGYAVIPTYDRKRTEHRSFQELLAKQALGNGASLLHRLRFEQRFLQGIDDTAFRLRYFGRFTHPLTALHPNLSLAINEEVFIHLNDTDAGPQSGFNQNRLFIGLNYRLSKSTAFDVGYQNQFVNGQNGSVDVVNHIAFFGIINSF